MDLRLESRCRFMCCFEWTYIASGLNHCRKGNKFQYNFSTFSSLLFENRHLIEDMKGFVSGPTHCLMRGRRCEPDLCKVFVFLRCTSTTLVTLDRTWTQNIWNDVATAQWSFPTGSGPWPRRALTSAACGCRFAADVIIFEHRHYFRYMMIHAACGGGPKLFFPCCFA